MRDAFCQALMQLEKDPDFMFMTGDLGFGALEPLREILSDRFINAGVAEQNMVGVAAGLASEGFNVWVYSIAPFLYARAFEQIRNDLTFHQMPVKLVGNGGGYGYGVMGSTHHAIEDYGVLLTLQNLEVLVPAFKEDLPAVITIAHNSNSPCYLRLGRCEKPKDFIVPKFSQWRKLLHGQGPTVVVIGPIVGDILNYLLKMADAPKINLWVVGALPLSTTNLDPFFLQDLSMSKCLIVAEEHVAHGGLGQQLLWTIKQSVNHQFAFYHHHACGYKSGRYGSQHFHRKESALNPESIVASIHDYESTRN